jgi:hypothetical protein
MVVVPSVPKTAVPKTAVPKTAHRFFKTMDELYGTQRSPSVCTDESRTAQIPFTARQIAPIWLSIGDIIVQKGI